MDSLAASRRGTNAGLKAVIAASDAVLEAIDPKEIACILAVKCPEDTPGENQGGQMAVTCHSLHLAAFLTPCTFTPLHTG